MGYTIQKNGNEMATAIDTKIIRHDGRCPKNLQTDMGKEFYNANMQKLLKKHNISLFNIFVMKVSVIELFNHMLKNNTWK